MHACRVSMRPISGTSRRGWGPRVYFPLMIVMSEVALFLIIIRLLHCATVYLISTFSVAFGSNVVCQEAAETSFLLALFDPHHFV